MTSINNLIESFPTRFNGLANCPGKLNIVTDSSIYPVIHAPRRVPLHIRDEVATELKNMCKLGIITRIYMTP